MVGNEVISHPPYDVKHLLNRCVEKTSRNDCPVCLEDLHSSCTPCHILPCGHLLHTPCYKSLYEFNIYRCPTCNLSIGDLSSYWSRVSEFIMSQYSTYYCCNVK